MFCFAVPLILVLVNQPSAASAFLPGIPAVKLCDHHSSHIFQSSSVNEVEEGQGGNSCWASWALLISSWTDGVAESPQAKSFLKQGLTRTLLAEEQAVAEKSVESSAVFSPCCGPDTKALEEMEKIDKVVETIKENPDNIDSLIESLPGLPSLRVVYIPTALYALRIDSQNTPGKQRQRARADGKKRRNEVVRIIKELFQDRVSVQVVTVDLDDGSVKQPDGFEDDNASSVPKDGKGALKDWSPHFIYVEGGNTFWLHHCLTKGGWKNDLISAISGRNAAVYCGKSAGAILAGALVETATWKGWDDPRVVPGMEDYKDWTGVQGLNLMGGASFFPHMSDEWKSLVQDKREALEGITTVYALSDEEVCLCDGSMKSIVQLSTPCLMKERDSL